MKIFMSVTVLFLIMMVASVCYAGTLPGSLNFYCASEEVEHIAGGMRFSREPYREQACRKKVEKHAEARSAGKKTDLGDHLRMCLEFERSV